MRKFKITPQSTSAIRIGLLGPYGFGNLGDAAIQDAMIHNIRRYLPNAAIYGFSLNPKDTKERHNIESYPIVRTAYLNNAQHLQTSEGGITFNDRLKRVLKRGLKAILISDSVYLHLRTIWKEILFISKSYKILKTIDILVVSGGGQLDEYWGGAWGHPYTLFKWAILARAAKTRLVFMSVGTDLIASRMSRLFIKYSLLLASYRSYRDPRTLMLVEAMGVRPGGMVYPDLAYSLPVRRNRIKRFGGAGRSPIIGISPISAEAWTTPEDPAYRNYLSQLVSMVVWLVKKNYRILFFPMQVNADTPVINGLKERLNSHIVLKPKDNPIENRVLTVNDLIEEISMVDIVIASRLHGVILSLLMHKPVLAISCNKKVNIVMEDMGLSQYCIDLNQINLDSGIEKFISLESNANAIIGQIEGRVSTYAKALDQQYSHVFGEEPERKLSQSVQYESVLHADGRPS